MFHIGHFVVKKLVWNVPIKAFWFTKYVVTTILFVSLCFIYAVSVLEIRPLFFTGSQLSAPTPSKNGPALAPGSYLHKFLLTAPAPSKKAGRFRRFYRLRLLLNCLTSPAPNTYFTGSGTLKKGPAPSLQDCNCALYITISNFYYNRIVNIVYFLRDKKLCNENKENTITVNSLSSYI